MIQERSGQHILFHAVRVKRLREICIAAWTDAAFADRPDGSSTGGQILGLAPISLLCGAEAPVSLLTWSAGKLHRVARSISSAEVQAAAQGEDQAILLRNTLAELWSGARVIKGTSSNDIARLVPACLIVDSKHVYDACRAEVISLITSHDKRGALESMVLRESVAASSTNIRWVHGGAQLANPLTKPAQPSQLDRFFQKHNLWQIVDDPTFTSERKRIQQGISTLAPMPADGTN